MRGSKIRTIRDREAIVRRRKGEATRSWSISTSETVEFQRQLDEDGRKRRGGAKRGPVIFQQRGAQNFNGLSRSGEAKSECRRPKRRNMRARERDNATGE